MKQSLLNISKTTLPVFFGSFLLFSKAYAEGYTLLEPLPGLGGPQTVASYVPVVIRLGIVLAALLAVVVIIIAGFMYITSAGNTGKLEKAKTLVFDAIIGLLIAVGYWLILQAINPAILGGDIGLDSFPDGQVVDVPDSGPTHGVGGPGGEGPVKQCVSDADCPSGICTDGTCEPLERPQELLSDPWQDSNVDWRGTDAEQEPFTYDASADSSNWDWLGGQDLPIVEPPSPGGSSDAPAWAKTCESDYDCVDTTDGAGSYSCINNVCINNIIFLHN